MNFFEMVVMRSVFTKSLRSYIGLLKAFRCLLVPYTKHFQCIGELVLLEKKISSLERKTFGKGFLPDLLERHMT